MLAYVTCPWSVCWVAWTWCSQFDWTSSNKNKYSESGQSVYTNLLCYTMHVVNTIFWIPGDIIIKLNHSGGSAQWNPWVRCLAEELTSGEATSELLCQTAHEWVSMSWSTTVVGFYLYPTLLQIFFVFLVEKTKKLRIVLTKFLYFSYWYSYTNNEDHKSN